MMKQPKMSVIMSVYNETEEEILQSVDSVLNQTFDDFEFIIVNDNPNNQQLKLVMDNMAKMDDRITIINNPHNVGLAISMNRASEAAHSDIFVRMDADDIAYPNRFQTEYDILISGKYDLVCSGYISINETGEHIEEYDYRPQYVSSQVISDLLPRKSVIHHPTVMMTKDILNKVHGYRGFPCAQDYDLWLRMKEAGARFYIVPEPLLKYRIRSNSTSIKKQIQQKLTIEYIRELYIERLRKGEDSFSKDNYNAYIEKYIKNAEKYLPMVIEANEELRRAIKMKRNHDRLGSLIIHIKVILFNPVYRHIYIRLVYSILRIRFYGSRRNG